MDALEELKKYTKDNVVKTTKLNWIGWKNCRRSKDPSGRGKEQDNILD